MTLNDIDAYLSASRGYIENAKRRLSQLGFCCPAMFIGELEDKQRYYERLAWSERHRDGSMGLWWLAVYAAGAVVSILGTKIYEHYTEAKSQSQYLDCMKGYEDLGRSPEEAQKLCGGGGTDVKTNIAKTIQTVIYGAVAIMALYVVSKLVKKK